ncbi:hypothetical protein BJV78DRAFT_1253749 [Lactifluus subvellereus]|nr:hypothetical protein BJV78DRAFT_1253749 [Lactifluus subvellereus]
MTSISTTTENPAILCALAFSEYHLWSNPSLRDPNRDGYVSLSTLLHSLSLFLEDATLTEASLVKSLRTHARDSFDVRMIVVDKTRRASNVGGYEVRRKDWAEITQRFPTFSPEYWDARTIYIENIPLSFRSTVGILKMLHALIAKDDEYSSSQGYHRSIQSIIFSPHHQDPPDALPKCKGFALVTLSDPTTASHLLARFPYKREHDGNKNDAPQMPAAGASDAIPPEELEARRAGFRTLSKGRWEALQAEYAAYRDDLLRRIAASSSSAAPPAVHHPPAPTSTQPQGDEHLAHARAEAPPPSYPPGCVIFARHVPQDTNKTVLRALFAALLVNGSSALDYVDYTKGLDSCYLRLTSREHALSLLRRFEERAGERGEESAITLELLEERREEVYWQNVPEKVRALAMQRAQTHEAQPGGVGPHGDDEDSPMGASGRKKRRRRR